MVQTIWIGALDKAYVTSWKSGLNFNALDLLISVLSNKAVLELTKHVSRFQDEVASQFDTTVKVIKESLQTIRGNLQMSSSLQGLLMSTLTKDMFLMIKYVVLLKMGKNALNKEYSGTSYLIYT